jgi:hypothetical protein
MTRQAGAVLGMLFLAQAASAQSILPVRAGSISSNERAALIDLFSSTSGESWRNKTNWGGAIGTECWWYGVTCDSGGNTVQGLNLSANNLVGTLPATLGNLTGLQGLDLGYNSLTGPIPVELGSLADLRALDLHFNRLTGSIPGGLGNLSKLEILSLGANQLSGSIPPPLGKLTNLVYLDLASDRLLGSIPTALGSLTKLESLDLSSNRLTGSIPTALGSLTNLTYLQLESNQLTGSIPTQLGNLTNLQRLRLAWNQLAGPIPTELGSLVNLRGLTLELNRLTGPIPTELGNLGHLESITVWGNALSGAIPSSLKGLGSLLAGSSDFRWNALYSTDAGLTSFLNGKQYLGDWQSTQTIAPAGVATGATTSTSVALSWTPIVYTGDTGGYQVYYSTTSGGTYTTGNLTANKSSSSVVVSGLNPGTPYYFVVRTVTNPNGHNLNTVTSDPSAEVRATTDTSSCTSPSISSQPQAQSIQSGQVATLSVTATGTAPLAYQWYQGAAGDTSQPVGTNASSYTTPALTATASYWVGVSNACGHEDSATATITVVRRLRRHLGPAS